MAHIAVLEDDNILLELYRDVLQRQGHDIEAFDAMQDMEAFFEDNTVDLVISDLRVGLLEGDETIAALKQIADKTQIPMLLISAQMMIYEQACKDAGFKHTMIKPFPNTVLVEKINAILGSS